MVDAKRNRRSERHVELYANLMDPARVALQASAKANTGDDMPISRSEQRQAIRWRKQRMLTKSEDIILQNKKLNIAVVFMSLLFLIIIAIVIYLVYNKYTTTLVDIFGALIGFTLTISTVIIKNLFESKEKKTN